MPNARQFPELCGYVFVAAHTDELLTRAQSELDHLADFGWKISNDAQTQASQCHMQIMERAKFESEHPSKATIVLCKTPHDAAIDPDGFAILSVLGGGMIERDLAASVDTDVLVDRVLVGLNWTMVYAGDYCGIARSPERGTEGARSILTEAGFRGRPLKELANMLCSTDALSRSMGLAAINAFWNQPPETAEKPGFARFEAPGDGLVIIGGFRDAQKRLPNAKIVEREPMCDDVPVADCNAAITGAKYLAITAQTLMNGSLEPLLRATPNVAFRMLIGPSAPLCPVLLDYGLNDVSGTAVWDSAATEQFILETGTNLMRDEYTRNASIRR